MDTNINPQELPRVTGWVMVAPAGAVVPPAVRDGCRWAAGGWSDEWRMPDDFPALATIVTGCPDHDDVAFSVKFYGYQPQIHLPEGTHMVMVVDASQNGIRLILPDVSVCIPGSVFHIHDGDPAWRVLVAGYYGDPIEVRPYRPAAVSVPGW